MRTTSNQITDEGTLVNGFDYNNQAWVLGGVYQDCGHPQAGSIIPARSDSFYRGGIQHRIVIEESVFDGCHCYGRAHAGEKCLVRGDGR
jgi:hypothetical protein